VLRGPCFNDATAEEVAGTRTSETLHSEAAAETGAAVSNWETRLQLVQWISAVLVVFSGLGLIILIAIRSRGG
jgi:phage baseplate assembly protein W